MPEIGLKLQKRREELGYDYDYIYQKTKIHPKVLKALEEEEFQKFTSPIYLKSFLKKYAEFLGLESKFLLAEVEKILSQEKIWETPRAVSPVLFSPLEKIIFGIKVLFSFFVVILSIYLILSGVNKIASYILPKKIRKKEEIISMKEKYHPSKVSIKEPLLQKINAPLRLSIEAKEDCWLQLRADNEKIFEGILKKGEKENWEAKGGFELWVGEASRLKLTLNGIPLGPLGRGVIKGIKIDSRGLKLP